MAINKQAAEGGEEREGVKEKRMWPTVKDDWRGVELCLIIDPAVRRLRQKCYWGTFFFFFSSSHNRIFTRRAPVCAFNFVVDLSVCLCAACCFASEWQV